jgi:hypothetical protein
MFAGDRMMFAGNNRSLIVRGLRAAALLAVAHFSSFVLHAAVPVASVAVVQPTRIADLVMLSGGFSAGLRQGMVCRVTRGATDIAEILVVELRPTCSAALIVSVAPKQSIHAGDSASIKVLKS